MSTGSVTAEDIFEKTIDAITVIQSSVAMLYKEVRRREDARANLQKENEDLRARIVELEKAK